MIHGLICHVYLLLGPRLEPYFLHLNKEVDDPTANIVSYCSFQRVNIFLGVTIMSEAHVTYFGFIKSKVQKQ